MFSFKPIQVPSVDEHPSSPHEARSLPEPSPGTTPERWWDPIQLPDLGSSEPPTSPTTPAPYQSGASRRFNVSLGIEPLEHREVSGGSSGIGLGAPTAALAAAFDKAATILVGHTVRAPESIEGHIRVGNFIQFAGKIGKKIDEVRKGSDERAAPVRTPSDSKSKPGYNDQ